MPSMPSSVLQVTLINLDDALEAVALRGALEWWGVDVTLRHVGTAAQLVTLLDGTTPLGALVFLLCHGDERGILLPELAPEVAAGQPFVGAIGPDDMRQFGRLPGCTVINTGCATGTPAFAAAFLAAGATTYVGPVGYPDGDAALFYCLAFAYDHLVRGMSVASAHDCAAGHDDETALFRLYGDGRK